MPTICNVKNCVFNKINNTLQNINICDTDPVISEHGYCKSRMNINQWRKYKKDCRAKGQYVSRHYKGE